MLRSYAGRLFTIEFSECKFHTKQHLPCSFILHKITHYRQCKLCRGECESVVHVLWECPAYDSIRNNFMVELENLLGGRFGEFSTLDNFNKASFILGFENWNRDDFKALLKLVKSFVLLIWETRKKELYGDQDCVVSGCSCSCPLTGGLTSSACVCGCVVNGVSATAAT